MILHILFYKEVRIQGCNTGKKKHYIKKKMEKSKSICKLRNRRKLERYHTLQETKG